MPKVLSAQKTALHVMTTPGPTNNKSGNTSNKHHKLTKNEMHTMHRSGVIQLGNDHSPRTSLPRNAAVGGYHQ